MFKIISGGSLAVAFGVGITVGVVGIGALNSEQTRTNIEAAYQRVNLQNVLKFCGTVWMVSAATGWWRYCIEEVSKTPPPP